MIHWYRDLYMDESVQKNPEKCKKRVAKRKPWKKSYVAIALAQNPANLFELIETRQLFFRRYQYLDMYVIGLATNKKEAVTLLQKIVKDIWYKNPEFQPREFFDKSDFSEK